MRTFGKVELPPSVRLTGRDYRIRGAIRRGISRRCEIRRDGFLSWETPVRVYGSIYREDVSLKDICTYGPLVQSLRPRWVAVWPVLYHGLVGLDRCRRVGEINVVGMERAGFPEFE